MSSSSLKWHFEYPREWELSKASYNPLAKINTSFSSASYTQSKLPQPISLRSILIPSSHLRLGLSSGLFPSGFLIKTLYTFLSHACHVSRPPHSPSFDLSNTIWGGVQNMNLLSLQLYLNSFTAKYFVPVLQHIFQCSGKTKEIN
jgi:hypothetical protein